MALDGPPARSVATSARAYLPAPTPTPKLASAPGGGHSCGGHPISPGAEGVQGLEKGLCM